MNTNLRSNQPTKQNLWLKTLLLMLPFLFGSVVEVNAQCIGPYQYFESIPSTGLSSNVSPGLTTNGWANNLTSLSTTVAQANSGRYAVTMNTAARFIQTPALANPGNFSFYWKASAAAGYSFEVRYSSDPTFATYTVMPGGTFVNTGATAYALASFDLVAAGVPSGSYIRVQCTAARAIFLDDFAITSSDPTENTIIVPRTGAATCTVPLVSGQVYTFYDNGGASDTHSASQNNNMVFDPAPGEQVELVFSNFTGGATSDVDLINTAPALSNHTGNVLPSPATYLGTAADVNVTFNLSTTVSTTPSAGYVITVRSIPPVATCSNPTAVTIPSGQVQANAANVTFTPPGAAPSNGYEYYVSTVNTAPPAGALATPSGSGAGSPMAMTGLAPNTQHYAWIRSYCGGSLYGDWIAAPVFTTKCSAYPIPYSEDFNGLNGPVPICTLSTPGSAYATNIVNGNLFTATEGASFFTKPLNLVGGTIYRLTFDYGTINGVADFDVAWGGTNFTPTSANILTTLNSYSGASTLTTAVWNFTPATSGTYYVRFTLEGVSNPGSTQFNLDNINIEVETCFPPTALTASAVTASSATVSWTAPATAPSNGYQYYISTSNVQPDYSTPPTGTSTGTTVNLSPLTSGTQYYIWVRSNCSGKYSRWSAVGTFTTITVTVTTINMPTTGTLNINMNCNNVYNFFDSGGSAAVYVDYENGVQTFTPGVGRKVKVVFTSFSTEANWDGLSIYNGNSTAAPLISSGLAAGFNAATAPAGSFYGTTSPGTIISTAADGALTFRFTSDFIIVRPGWSATITCVTAPTITSFTPLTNNCGTPAPVIITGTNFSGAGVPPVTGVLFNGVPVAAGNWTVNSATQITVSVVPPTATSGPISVTNAEAVGYSPASYTVNPPPPTTTGVVICSGGSGTISSSTTCTGFNQVTSVLAGALTAGVDPVAPRPTTSTANSTNCAFAAVTSNYVGIQFQVSATGLYSFGMSSTPTVDGMGYITSGPFVPGSCGAGTWIIGDDDSGPGTFPLISVNLTAGVTYTLWTTVWSGGSTTWSGNFSWAVSSPGGGTALLYSNALMQWYTVPTGGTALPTGGSPFNPVGVPGSGVANTNVTVATTYNFYAACASNPTCRTLTTFVINPNAVAGTVSANQTICNGSSPANITLTGSTGDIQWQSSPDNTTWSNITGAIATPLTSVQMGPLSAVRYYRAVLTTPCSTVNSAVVTVNVNPTSVAGTVTPATTNVCSGTNSTLLTVTGSTGIAQWQSSPDNTAWTNVGTPGTTYTATNLLATTYYRVVVTSGVCPAANSTSVVINVSPATVAGTITPATTNVCSGTNSTLLTLAGNTGTIQWQSSPDNTAWTNIPSATTATYTAVNLIATTYYRAVVTSGACGAQNTTSVVVNVSPAAVAGTITPAITGVCSGTNSTLLTLAGSTGTIQWQSSPDNAAWTDIPSANAATYTAVNLVATTYYRAVLTSGVCPPQNAASVVINVSAPAVAGTVTPTTTDVCAGTNSTLLTLTGSTGSIQWQSSPNNTAWTNIPSANAATYTAVNLNATTYYRAVLTSGACPAQNSASVVVNVSPVAVAGTAAASQIICPGNPANITLTGAIGTIQWQSSPDNTTWTNVSPGGTAATLLGTTVGPLAATTYFRAVVTSGLCLPVNSNVVTVTVTAAVGGTTSPASQNTCITISDLTITGYTGTIVRWEWATTAAFAVPNTIAASASATLTSAQIGAFSGTRYYRAVITAGSCTAYSSVADITYNSTTWGPGWSNGVPDSTTAAIFAVDYTLATTLDACSLHILPGADVIVNPGVTMTIQNEVVVDAGATLTFENTSSLIQVNDAAVNSGFVTYKRRTPRMRMYDYTYWSSPLYPQTLFGVSPLTLSDKYFQFNTAGNVYQQIPSSSLMVPGKGYIIRAPQGFPYAPATGTQYNAVFDGGAGDGVPNNGIITLPLVVAGANIMNLIGNPYPCALNADALITTNAATMDGVLYFWTHNTAINSNQYTGSDYAIYTLAGGVGTSPATNPGISPLAPNGHIGAGQGFFVKALSPAGNVVFNNSMRENNNSQFYRPGSGSSTPGALEKHRYWVEIKNDLGAYKQMLVGYIETATNQRDQFFDGDFVDAGNVVGMYTIAGSDKYSIQGRALSFDVNDQVPMGYKMTYAGAYQIQLSDFDGLFANQDIYLEDKLLNVIHNLKLGSYTFTTEAGVFDDRFVLRYTNGTALGVGQPLFNDNTVIVYKDNMNININTSNVMMQSVKIFDVRGRLIAEKNNIGANSYQFIGLPETQQVLLVKVISEDGAIVTKKLIF